MKNATAQPAIDSKQSQLTPSPMKKEDVSSFGMHENGLSLNNRHAFSFGGLQVHRVANGPFGIQPKLSINQPDDVYEQEADATAEKVMRMNDATPGATPQRMSVMQVQREPDTMIQRDETTDQSKPSRVEPLQSTTFPKLILPGLTIPKPAAPNLGVSSLVPPKLDIPNLGIPNLDKYLPDVDKAEPLKLPDVSTSSPSMPDYGSMQQPFITRGVYHLWDADSAAQLWTFTLGFYQRLGLKPDVALTLTRFTTSRYIDSTLSVDNKSRWETSDQELNTTTHAVSIPALEFDANFSPTWSPLFKSVGSKIKKVLQRKESGAAGTVATNGRTENYINSLNGKGKSLPAAERHFFESRMGYNFSKVQVHTDAEANDSSRSIKARAYTYGNHIVFGSGQYQPATKEGRRLLAHELTHTIQQGAGKTTDMLQRDPIDDARKKLSYGVFDWAITDAEAREVLTFLSRIPEAKLPGELNRLGQKYITRFLDNLPENAKTGDAYQRIINALGVKGVMPYATDQLSYGLFDWAITDADVTKVFSTMKNLPPSSFEDFFTNLNKENKLARLIDNATASHHELYERPWIKSLNKGNTTSKQNEILRTIVENSDDIETIKLAVKVRFGLDAGQSAVSKPEFRPADWDIDKLKRVYLMLDKQPDAHIVNNDRLKYLGQYDADAIPVPDTDKTSIVAGRYNKTDKSININKNEKADPKQIDHTVLHEIGHTVDPLIPWTDAQTHPQELGGWERYGGTSKTYNACANDMIDDSGAGIKVLPPTQRTDVVKKIEDSMSQRSIGNLKADIQRLSWFPSLSVQNKRTILEDPALHALEVGVEENMAWDKEADGGIPLKEHVYIESYGEWNRYDKSARDRKMSTYQFAGIKDWFAECYAFYYSAEPRGKGPKLKDSQIKKYFDEKVDGLNRPNSQKAS